MKRLCFALVLLMSPGVAWADKTTIAVAANFTAAAKKITTAFESETGHEVVLAYGSTGKLFAQIAYGAPFDAFLAADAARPTKAVKSEFALGGTQFTYALGKIVLYSADATLIDAKADVLGRPDSFAKLAIANPKTAPYGVAAVEALQKLGVYDDVRAKIVKGDNIAQTHQFVMTENAEMGFVALAQVIHEDKGSTWIVPNDMYAPIRQDAVVLERGKDNVATRAFVDFLKSDKGREIIQSYGYGVEE